MKTTHLAFFSIIAAACNSSPNNSNNDMAAPPDMVMPGPATQKLKQTNLTADTGTGAGHVDANLLNPWGLAFNPAGPAWVSDNHSGFATVYDSTGTIIPLVVTIPPPGGGAGPAAPTGQIYNGTAANFMGDKFIFATEDGTISGWQTGTTATLRVDSSAGGASYKGFDQLTKAGATRIYAADFHNNKVDVFDSTYAPVTLNNGFKDTTIPQGFAPFNIVGIAGTLYVAYAKQDNVAGDDVKGPGNGFINTFDFDGNLIARFVSQGALNSPWAITKAPADFGALSNLILVGNFGDGGIHAYDTTGALKANVTDATGAPLAIEGLWALTFGNDTTGQAHNQLFFTAGPNDEADGLYGRLDLP